MQHWILAFVWGVVVGTLSSPLLTSAEELFLKNYPHTSSMENSSRIFQKLANRATHPHFTDKVLGHSFQLLYGAFLLPFIDRFHADKAPLKLMEVGMGCNPKTAMKKKGVDIWAQLLNQPEDSIWIAEYNERCLTKMKRGNMIPSGVNVVTGDQANKTTLEGWIVESGGNYDVFIDDGGHSNNQIMTTFNHMWPQVKPGGLYFIEDLHVSRHPSYEDTKGRMVVADVMRDWVEQLMIPGGRVHHPLPEKVKMISCQPEMCVLMKCASKDRKFIKNC
mmetsp:Transcript_20783/g.34993  ORF Transcript_20783/g.34993 Transcript_20783/m.34993 type:complete len:276 (+) Transcript_20783:86-913(+)